MNIQPKNWSESFKWQYGAYPFFTSVYSLAAKKQKNKYRISWGEFACSFDRGHFVGYLPKQDINRAGELIIKESLAGRKGYLQELKQVHQEIAVAIKSCEQVSNSGAAASLRDWWPETQRALSAAAAVLFSFDYHFDSFLKELQAKNAASFDSLMAASRPHKESFIDLANSYLFKLLQAGYDFDVIHERFMGKFGWLQNSYAGVFALDKSWLKKHAKEVAKSRRLKAKTEKIVRIESKYRILAEIAREGVVFRDDKKKLLLVAAGLMDDWLRSQCRKYNLSFNDLRWFTLDEVRGLIKTRDFKNIGRYEKQGRRIGLLREKSYQDISKRDWQSIAKAHDQTISRVIAGIAASRGIARGVARIILDPHVDGHRLKKGDILITSMTRPEFLPIMKKAAAYVTDEGGVTCHAAIVAREMHKPCIIGTKNGTKILIDGEMIEVDADTGTVKKI